MAYQVSDAVFVGHTQFMPDVGTASGDFPGGIHLYTYHDYQPDDRRPAWASTVAEQRASNIHIRDGVCEEAFIAMSPAKNPTNEQTRRFRSTRYENAVSPKKMVCET